MIDRKPSGASLRETGSHPAGQTNLRCPDASRFDPARFDIELPWPNGLLAGHHSVHWRVLQPVKAKHKTWAKLATLCAEVAVADKGDIRVSATFYPPNKRGDRVNYPILLKPYWDGIAEALGINDRRFLPSYHFAEPVSNARVVVSIG